jgi:hypothetical protein
MKRRGFLQGVAAAIAFVSAAASGFGAGLANVCSKVVSAKRRIILPPIPKWNDLTDDIDGADYMKRSEDFERSLLPKDLVVPREGQVWEVVRDCEVAGRRLRENRTTFLGKVPLRKGERVRILPLDHPKPLQVSFQRLAPDQANYLLWVRTARTVPGQGEDTAYFNELFRLVSA